MSPLFRNLSVSAKTALIVEIVVGVAILLGGIFLIVSETKAPTPTPSVSATPATSTYISSLLQISLKYPYGWRIDPTFNGIPGIERYEGPDGFFQVDATNDPTRRKGPPAGEAGMLIMKYPKPIILGETKYRYFKLIADTDHLESIGQSVEFLNK